jgi:enoyl-CoA hydratase
VITSSQQNGILRLTIDRPAVRNAFDGATTQALAEAVEAAARDGSARVLVIAGAGGTFSTGRDLKAIEEGSEPRGELLARHDDWVRIFHALHRLRIPSVAAVDGYAVAGGFTLAMGCDFVLATRAAKFGALEMRNGFPASVCTPILARLLGPRLGLELALFGEVVGAERLYEIGLVNRLADDAGELESLTADFAGRLAALDPDAVALTRETFRAAENMPIDNALDMGKHLNQLLATSGWFAEGARRGLDKSNR